MSETGESILRGAREARDYARGGRAWFSMHVPAKVDVRSIRRKTGLSQAMFAGRFGFTVAAVRNWEQGRRQPDLAARALLMVIDREPDAVRRALAAPVEKAPGEG